MALRGACSGRVNVLAVRRYAHKDMSMLSDNEVSVIRVENIASMIEN